MAAISGWATAFVRGGSADFMQQSMKRTASDRAPFVFGRLAACDPFNKLGGAWEAMAGDPCRRNLRPPGWPVRHA